ncbi:MAG: Gldg family protein [Clostridia bacterium]|nr:Gldg family protein [Clostridia bacterium]
MKLKRLQRTLDDVTKKSDVSALRKFFSSRKAKYGSVAVLFTTLVLLFALLFNVLLGAISENMPLTLDFSASRYFTLSEVSKKLIADAMPEEDEAIRIRFMMPEDQLKENEYYNMVLECAKSYREQDARVQVDFLDIVTRPSDVADYRKLGLHVDSLSVIVDCPAKNRVKMFGMESCFLTREGASSYYGFDGETQFTAAIMAVCRDKTPVVTFTQGHGETVPVQLERMFTTAGYTVARTNLANEPLDPATEILVISDPQTDFLGIAAGEKNEIDTITEYLNTFRDVMVFLSPETQSLPELDALLSEWGIIVHRGVALLDDAQSLAGSGGKVLISAYGGEAYLTDGSYSTLGSALHKNLSTQQSAPMTLVSTPAPIELTITNTSGEAGSRSADSVLVTSPEAYLLGEDGKKEVGTYTLMALSSVAGYEGDDTVYSHMLVCGSASFTEMVAAGDSSYGNSEIIYTAMTLMSKEMAPQGIALKKLDDTTLTVPEGYAQTAMLLSMTVLPGVMLVLGTVVYLRRRHK